MMSALRSSRMASQLVARQSRLLPGAASSRNTQRLLSVSSASSRGGMMDADALVTSRRAVERLAPKLRFNIAGVSFDDRQNRVAKLEKGQALMLLHEPTNIYDKNAVAVRTLDGCDLGFVPKDFNMQLQDQGVSFASVVSVGQNEAQKWGAQIGTTPRLLSCALQPMPFQDALRDVRELGPGSKAFAEAMTESRGSCEVTGMTQASLTQALRPMPCWRYNVGARKAEFVRLAVVCPQVLTCLERLRRIDGPDGEQRHDEAVALACEINGWVKEDMENHLSWFLDMEDRMLQEDWSVSY